MDRNARQIRVAVENRSPAQVSHAKTVLKLSWKCNCLKVALKAVLHIIFLGHL